MVASLSEANPANGNQDLFITRSSNAEVLPASQVQTVKAIAQTQRGTLMLLKEDLSTLEVTPTGESTGVQLRTDEDKSAFYSAYLSR